MNKIQNAPKKKTKEKARIYFISNIIIKMTKISLQRKYTHKL